MTKTKIKKAVITACITILSLAGCYMLYKTAQALNTRHYCNKRQQENRAWDSKNFTKYIFVCLEK